MMINLNASDYVLCVWGLGKPDVDIMGVVLRHEGEPWFKTLIRFGYGEGDSTSLFDRRNWMTADLEGKTEKEVGEFAHEIFRKFRRRGDIAAFRFVRGGPEAFMRTLTTMPLIIKSETFQP